MAGKDSSNVYSGLGKFKEISDQFKIREKSGNVDSGQGKVKFSRKVGEKSGNIIALTVSQSFQTLAFIFIMFELLTKEHSISLVVFSGIFTFSIFTSGGFCRLNHARFICIR